MNGHYHNETYVQFRQQALMQEAENNRLAAQVTEQHPNLARRALSLAGDVLVAAGTRLQAAQTPAYQPRQLARQPR
jgi:hypothetical protein